MFRLWESQSRPFFLFHDLGTNVAHFLFSSFMTWGLMWLIPFFLFHDLGTNVAHSFFFLRSILSTIICLFVFLWGHFMLVYLSNYGHWWPLWYLLLYGIYRYTKVLHLFSWHFSTFGVFWLLLSLPLLESFSRFWYSLTFRNLTEYHLIIFYYVKVIRQFECLPENLLMMETYRV
jgi:hypothetical protein